jgi:hypothetical protein
MAMNSERHAADFRDPFAASQSIPIFALRASRTGGQRGRHRLAARAISAQRFSAARQANLASGGVSAVAAQDLAAAAKAARRFDPTRT